MVCEQQQAKGGCMASPLASRPAGSQLRPVYGDSGPPLVGYTFRFMRHPLAWAQARYDAYGPVSWSRAFGLRIVSALGADANEVVLGNRDKAFSQAGWRDFIGPFFSRGLMLLDFDEHHRHRRIMQQAFTKPRLRRYLDQLDPAIDRGLSTWRPDEHFRVYPALKQLTLDLACEVFMDLELGREADRVNRAFVATVRAGTAFLRLPVPGGRWWAGLRGRKQLERFFESRIAEKRRGDGDDLFSVLCHAESDDGQRFSDEDVVNHMIFLMMAAHDTSTITLSAMCYYLAKHPEWQQRLRAESLALDSPTVGYDELDQLPSLDLVMNETLRLVAPVPTLARKTVAETELLGHYLPAETLVNVSPHFTHRSSLWWSDPHRFDPTRFESGGGAEQAHRYAWVPFGGGAHKCIGMAFGANEVKAVMHQMLRRFQWSVEPDYELPLDYTSLPVPADGLPIRLESAVSSPVGA
jgi:cytochrome P450